jgi:hypothetical protein
MDRRSSDAATSRILVADELQLLIQRSPRCFLREMARRKFVRDCVSSGASLTAADPDPSNVEELLKDGKDISYETMYYIFLFNELSEAEKLDALTIMREPAEAAGGEAGAGRVRGQATTTMDDYVRLLHLFQEPKLG